MTDVAKPAETISYATPQAFPRPPRLLAAVWLGVIGLALIVLGASFTIGIAAVIISARLAGMSGEPQSMDMTFFVVASAFMAFCCLAIALLMLLRAVVAVIAHFFARKSP